MEKLKSAILGFGRSGSTLHADAIASCGQFNIVAICDIDPKRQEQAKKRFNCRAYDDIHKLIQAEKPDLVSVVTRTDQHSQMVCECLEAGANVLVTKPWARDAAQAQSMIDAAKKTGRKLFPWLPARWGGDLLRLREIVNSGVIGKVFAVRRVQPSFAIRSDWQTETAHGGGYLLNWGPHLVDTAVKLTGAKVLNAYGRLKHLVNAGDAEDAFLAVMNLDNDVVAIAEYTFAPPIMPQWIIQGQSGAITVMDDKATIYMGRQVRPLDANTYGVPLETWSRQETIKLDWDGEARQIYTELAQALRGEKPFAVTPQDALELTRTLDAIRQSDREGRIVPLS